MSSRIAVSYTHLEKTRKKALKERKESGYELREAKKKEEIRRERKQLTRKERREAKKKDKRRAKQKKEVNKEFARVTYIFVALFLVLMGYIIYFNLEKSQDIINSSYNPRLDSMADRVVPVSYTHLDVYKRQDQ